MISQAYITEWQQHAPWPQRFQIEQDLVICRALVEIFDNPLLSDTLAFRGGTALFKLHMPAVRYSEDVDLVQVKAGAIGPIMNEIRAVLNPWLGSPKWKQTQGRVTFHYRFVSEDGLPLNLKIEINTREHFSIYGFKKHHFRVDSRWFKGSAEIQTYQLEELLATKLRALYQRNKGRDLFDLWFAFNNGKSRPSLELMVVAFLKYMENEGLTVSRANFEQNLSEKQINPLFTDDLKPLLSTDKRYDFQHAYEFVIENIVVHLPGEAWRGKSVDER